MVLQSIAGLFVFSLFAWLISENRKKIRAQTVLVGIGLCLLASVLVLPALLVVLKRAE